MPSTDPLVHIGLGSNLGNREEHLNRAVDALQAESVQVVQVSDYYQTPPVGMEPGAQPFLNAALAARTEQSPRRILRLLQAVEAQQGRVRPATTLPEGRYHPRTLDLDLLLWGNLRLRTPELVIPHPRLHERAFVLVPLAQIAPHAVHPVLKRTIAELRDACPGTERCVLYPR